MAAVHQSIHEFVNNVDRATLEVVPVPSIHARDPFLRLKNMIVPTVNVGE